MLENSAEKVFESIMATHQLSARVTNNMTRCGQWVQKAPQWNRGIFHLVAAGSCRVEASFLPVPVTLVSGDLMVLPRGGLHTLRDSTQGPAAASAETSDTSLLCGEFICSGIRRNPVIDALPDYFVVHEPENVEHFRALGSLLIAQCSGTSFGGQVIMNKIADLLLAWAIQSHLAQNPPRHGLLAALNDRRLSRALFRMYDHPERNWSIAELANIANLSRTAFFEHFYNVMGVAPMYYLREWRMGEALRLLRDPAIAVGRLAEDLGYRTESSFRRAFKNAHGFAPGHVRLQLEQEAA